MNSTSIHVLKTLKEYKDKNEISPTVRELGQLVGFSSSATIHGYITKLKKEGYVDNIVGSPRSLVVTEIGEMLLGSKGVTKIE